MEKIEFFFHWIFFFLCRIFRVRGYGISLIVPLFLDDPEGQRAKNWHWLRRYWRVQLPGSEIIIGRDEEAETNHTPFSKSVAVNQATRKALGDIFVIVDADVFVPRRAVLLCAKEIRHAERRGRRLWFIPYRRVFRLTREASAKILASSPWHPASASEEDVTNTGKFDGTPISSIGHWYGAMIQIISRRGFEIVGGWDPRFKGWGGEDHAAMVATDTLYGPHKTLPTAVVHLWHPVLTESVKDDPTGRKRLWANQQLAGVNNALSGRYYWSHGNAQRMRKLVDEFREISCNSANMK